MCASLAVMTGMTKQLGTSVHHWVCTDRAMAGFILLLQRKGAGGRVLGQGCKGARGKECRGEATERRMQGKGTRGKGTRGRAAPACRHGSAPTASHRCPS